MLEGGFLKYYYEKDDHGINAQPKVSFREKTATIKHTHRDKHIHRDTHNATLSA